MSSSKAVKSNLTKLEAVAEKTGYSSSLNAVGTITRVTECGQPIIRLAGKGGKEFVAKTIVKVFDAEALIGSQVVVLVDEFMSDVPIVIGIVSESIVHNESSSDSKITEFGELSMSGDPVLTIDGQKINLVADQELVLSCGHSSLHLHKNGKVIIKGKEVQTRASGSNKIRGATVKIN